MVSPNKRPATRKRLQSRSPSRSPSKNTRRSISNNDNCPICMNPYTSENPSVPFSKYCAKPHLFCKECREKTLSMAHPRCPFCRASPNSSVAPRSRSSSRSSSSNSYMEHEHNFDLSLSRNTSYVLFVSSNHTVLGTNVVYRSRRITLQDAINIQDAHINNSINQYEFESIPLRKFYLGQLIIGVLPSNIFVVPRSKVQYFIDRRVNFISLGLRNQFHIEYSLSSMTDNNINARSIYGEHIQILDENRNVIIEGDPEEFSPRRFRSRSHSL